MSYNIDHIEVIKNDNFRIKASALKKLYKDYINDGEHWPESNFAEQYTEHVNNPTVKSGFVYIDHGFWYNGEGSGWAFDALKERLKEFKGSAELIVAWEGGDAVSGIRVIDGIVTEHEVKMSLL